MEGPASPRSMGSSSAGAASTSVAAPRSRSLRTNLLYVTATTTPGSRSALEHLARLAADELENVESFAQHLGRQNLDGDARQRLGKRLSDGFSPLIRRNRLLSLRLCGWRRQRFAAESKVANGERELRVILRQALRFLAEQAEL